MNITLHNDFHNTETTIRVSDGDVLSPRRVRGIWDRLCGFYGESYTARCKCGDELGRRGDQGETPIYLDPHTHDDGRIVVHFEPFD